MMTKLLASVVVASSLFYGESIRAGHAAPTPRQRVQAAKKPDSPRPGRASVVTHSPVAPIVIPRLPAIFAALKPLPSGPGVVVGDPITSTVASSADSDVAAFGAGCTRWLQLELSNHGALGKMPTWREFAHAGSLAHWPDWHLTPAQVPAVARILGVTHVVASRIAGQTSAATLTLQLFAVPGGKMVGKPYQVRGSYEAINAALPEAARTLLSRLDLETAGVPDTTGATNATLIACGRVPLDSSRPLAASPSLAAGLRRSLLAAAAGTPLAGVLAWRDTEAIAAPRRAWDFAFNSDSLGLKAFLAAVQPEALGPLPDAMLQSEARYPNNYLQAAARTAQARFRGEFDAAQQAAEYGVRCAPANPQAWLNLGDTLYAKSNGIRKGRVFDMMAESERAVVLPLYPKWQAAALQATLLDPNSGTAWLAVAKAATFNGSDLAIPAFWKAQRLAPDDIEVYRWGLDMFQPKWTGDTQSLSRVITLTADDPKRLAVLCGKLMSALAVIGLDDPRTMPIVDKVYRGVVLNPKGWFASRPQTRQALQATWQAVHQNARQAGAWRKWGELMRDLAAEVRLGRSWAELSPTENRAVKTLYGCGELAAQRWTQLEPKSSAAWLLLSQLISHDQGALFAVAAFGKAFSLSPQNPDVVEWGLNVLRGAGPEALASFIEHVADTPALFEVLAPNILQALQGLPGLDATQEQIKQRSLAQVEQMATRQDAKTQERLYSYFAAQGQAASALQAAENWVRFAPRSAEAELRLAGSLRRAGRADEAIAHYRQATVIDPNYGGAYYSLGNTLDLDKKQPEAAEAVFRQLTQVAPLWQSAWSAWGEMLIKSGHRAEARLAYARVVELGPAEDAPQARVIKDAAEQIETIDDTLALAAAPGH